MKPKVHKDREHRSRPTRVHVPKNKRFSRQDKVDGREIDDWYEQQVMEIENARQKENR